MRSITSAESIREFRWVSIKILTADDSTDSTELRVLQSLGKVREDGASSKCIVELLDHFLHQGPNGTHQCLVFELLGPTVNKVVRDYFMPDIHGYVDPEDRMEPFIVLKMAEQLLKAVEFIHKAGYVHGGKDQLQDACLSASNFPFQRLTCDRYQHQDVAFTCSRLSRATKEEVLDVLGRPEPEELARLDGQPLDVSLPKQLVETASWDWADEDEEDLRIIDFGEAFLQGTEPEKTCSASCFARA